LDSPAMILLHDAARQGQAQTPPSLLSCKPGLEDLSLIFRGNSRTIVGHTDHHLLLAVNASGVDNDLAGLLIAGLHAVLDQIFHYPGKQLRVDAGIDLFRRLELDADAHSLMRQALAIIVDHFLNQRVDGTRFGLRNRADPPE